MVAAGQRWQLSFLSSFDSKFFVSLSPQPPQHGLTLFEGEYSKEGWSKAGRDDVVSQTYSTEKLVFHLLGVCFLFCFLFKIVLVFGYLIMPYKQFCFSRLCGD